MLRLLQKQNKKHPKLSLQKSFFVFFPIFAHLGYEYWFEQRTQPKLVKKNSQVPKNRFNF